MGADLLLLAVPRAKMTKERRAKVDEFIAGLSIDDQEVNDFANRAMLDGDDTEENPNRSLELVREKLQEAVDDYGNFEEGLRDVTTFCLAPDMQHFVTGGMSWGDDPSESWSAVDAIISFAKLYEMLEGWAREDYLKSSSNRKTFNLWCQDRRQQIEDALQPEKSSARRLADALEKLGEEESEDVQEWLEEAELWLAARDGPAANDENEDNPNQEQEKP